MLPDIVPRARILAYNYESRWHKNASKTRIQVCGEELVNEIHDFRKLTGTSDRPLILIGHSLGGNVIQHGLLYSDTEPKFKYLPEVTVGLIFLGCPFKGSRIQKMAAVATQLLQTAGSDGGIIRDLHYGDPILLDKLSAFQRLLERNTVPFCAFIERKETDYGRKIGLVGIWKELVVDEESAGALGPHKFHLNTDHFKINKFSGPQDRSFTRVSSEINGMFTNWRLLIESRNAGTNRPGAQKRILENKARHEKIVTYLAKFDFSARYKDVFLTRYKGTGQWFLEAEAFQRWLNTEGQTLWCPGIPGAGKTILLAVAINYLQQRVSKQDEAVLFAFCDYKDRANQNAENVLLSLWRQLMQKRILSEVECESLEATYIKRGVAPTTDVLVKMISDEASKYPRVFILLDALDELDTESRDTLLYLLSKLSIKRNLLVTSRVPKEKTSQFRDVPQLEIRAKDTDITDYINGRLESVANLRTRVERNHRLREEIRSTVTKKADGMFLLVRLHMNSLASKYTVKDIRTDLKNLPEGENAISDTYEGAFSRIRDQVRNDRELGEKVILWISHVQRPLTLKDLQCILTVREGDTELDLDDLIPEEFLVSTCAGLVTVEDLSGEIRFVHSTAQEYFDSIKSTKFPGADMQITKSCIHYLSLSVFCTDTRGLDTTAFSHMVSKYPFLDYAALHWGLHARAIDDPTSQLTIEKLIKQFFNRKLESIFAVRTLLSGVAGINGAEMGESLAKNDRSIKLINVLAYFGFDTLIVELIANREEVLMESYDDFVGNVLHWAALGQHDTTLQLLLGQASSPKIINQKGYSLFTPLHLALVHRRDLSAELLLEHGPDVTATAHYGHTPLLVAALNGNSNIVPKLLSAKDGMETLLATGHGATTPFRAAAMWGHTDVMIHLLRGLENFELHGDLRSLDDDFSRNPLHKAAEKGYFDTCEVLLQSKHGAQFATSSDDWGLIPMELAIVHGHAKVTELFLNWDGGALLSSEPGCVAGALALAARSGQPMVVDMLLARHPEACNSDFREYTALHHAAYSGSVETVKVILDHSSEESALEATDISGYTPLIGAADRGQAEIVEYLIERGAMINATNRFYETSLHRAVISDVEEVIQILLRSGIDIDAKDSKGQTALDVAVEYNSPGPIRLLLDAGAQIPDGLVIPDTLEPTTKYFPEKPADQFGAYFYLKKASGHKLPQPLISHILDLAEYWLVRTTEHCEHRYASRLDGDTMVYLRTPPIVGHPQHPVRRIEYEIISHDQGFSGDSHLHGTYDGSYTWFDASRECSPGPFQDKASRILGPEILRNVHALYEWSTHRVSWCTITGVRSFRVYTGSNNDEVEEPVSTVRHDHRYPRPEPTKWITEINRGERLVVAAMAQFPGWGNDVLRGKVVVYTSCLKSSCSP
ncbi:hypothetical protein N7457_007066 [Penicillium paradoxum]|uniref:uncharacterized protein n=1 Tax=Penicillium paradoxum TaxID=176176 RepID=UPI002547148E|nr:uncharacterized protein N7457_007066 [Penicillium paradoxum]KAJ5779346.1 hypothetical protein N7457_007066 [Penicillium paradoxum]